MTEMEAFPDETMPSSNPDDMPITIDCSMIRDNLDARYERLEVVRG
jgi:hypothetical protein